MFVHKSGGDCKYTMKTMGELLYQKVFSGLRTDQTIVIKFLVKNHYIVCMVCAEDITRL